MEDSGYITGSGITALVEGVDVYESITGQLPRENDHRAPNDCVVAADAQARTSIERDFTTKGITGKLQCPFAKSGGSNRSVGQVEDGPLEACGRDELDPIKAEFRSDKESTAPMSGQSAATAGAAARCPIRYLDNHSPEALAKYFENHKHEIPRSHAVCIQRYQRDSQSRRFLDEKYGSLTNMVKGLGKYHQPYLSSAQEGPKDTQHTDASSAERVEKWAKDVDTRSGKNVEGHISVEDGEADGEDERANQFDRPLKDIRVGESPSRPWGVHVPVSGPSPRSPAGFPPRPSCPSGAAANGLSQDDKYSVGHLSLENPKSSERNRSAAARGCPFHMGGPSPGDKASNTHEKPKSARPRQTRTTKERNTDPQLQSHHTPDLNPASDPARGEPQPKVVFNGPVFFGYDPQTAASLLDKLGASPNAR